MPGLQPVVRPLRAAVLMAVLPFPQLLPILLLNLLLLPASAPAAGTPGQRPPPGTSAGSPAGIQKGPSPTNSPLATDRVLILEVAGAAELLPAGAVAWSAAAAGASLGLGDRFRTLARSRATLRLSDRTQLRVGESSELQVRTTPSGSPLYRLWRGVIFFFHRDHPGRFEIETPGASAAVRGTEFVLEANDAGLTRLSLLDGTVELSNAQGEAVAQSGQRVEAVPGQRPAITALLEPARHQSVQWCLYYPAVLHPADLGWRDDDQAPARLRPSLAAYRSGDLLEALRQLPAEGGADDESPSAGLFRAALLLSVGRGDQAGEILARWQEASELHSPRRPTAHLARALQAFIAVVRGGTNGLEQWGRTAQNGSTTATEWLAGSYVEQTRLDLAGALAAARRAAELAGDSGPAWARVAELEFGHGRTRLARESADRARALAPRHAAVVALDGFLQAARGDVNGALAQFDRAIKLDGGLGNGWLGRGLCRIRRGEIAAGLMDLQTAAVVEPQRSLFRSYLAKGYAVRHWTDLARREVLLARDLDPMDPTPWLYSAWINQEQHRLNRAVRELERSMELNDQRAVERSRFLLDEDRAVRGSSLADLYREAGLPEVALREAVRAVNENYASFAAHRLVAGSFNALRDPTRSSLRHETAWFSEWLLGTLLAPAGAVPLGQHVSLQEYTRLFEQNGLQLASSTEARSDGRVRELASQSGRFGNTGWSIDLDHEHHPDREPGVGRHRNLDRTETYFTLQHALTPEDTALVLVKHQHFDSGDTFQHYAPSNARPAYHLTERQEPIVLAGLRHEWGPGSQTLLAASGLQSDLRAGDVAAPQWVRFLDSGGQPLSFTPVGLTVDHRIQLALYGIEAQQILEDERQWLVLGCRWQGGSISTHSRMRDPNEYAADFAQPLAAAAALDGELARGSIYAYETLKLPAGLRLTGGAAWEDLSYPRNFRQPPLAPGEEHRHQLSPKAAAVWDVNRMLTARGAWLRSLGGVSLDESYRLEPTHLAGFVQDYRTVIPETLVSSVSGPRHEVAGAALDFKFPTQTWLTLDGQRVTSDVTRSIGAFDYRLSQPVPPRIEPVQLRQSLRYAEQTAAVRLRQLLGEEWTLGVWYAFTESTLRAATPGLAGATGAPVFGSEARLQELGGAIGYQHGSGLFARTESRWLWQAPRGNGLRSPADSMQQLDLEAGLRLPRQRGEIALAVLNLTGDNYRFQPVTPHPEFPHARVFLGRVRLRF